MDDYDVILIGGGLAGLCSAVHLASVNYNVLLLERNTYPHHKVCGEYVSNEVLPYLDQLQLKLPKTVSIDTLHLSTRNGQSLQTNLPLGGFGISRFAFDHALYQKAIAVGATVHFETVNNIEYLNDVFAVHTEEEKKYSAKIVIGAYGKRSGLDKQLNRDFISKPSPWLGVKAHYLMPDFPDNLVALHNFDGGYGGLSKTESGAVNFCYLASYKSFRTQKNIEKFNTNVVSGNKHLSHFLKNARLLFDEPMSIAQVSFGQKNVVEDHILMCGDTAGLIHPLCGNGMAMAIHSAKIASEKVDAYFKNKEYSRMDMEKDYTKAWNRAFKRRLQTGRLLQSILLHPATSNLLMQTVSRSPGLIRSLIKRTHGKPISI